MTEYTNGNGDRIFHGLTAEGEVFGIEVTDTPTLTAEIEDQGYSEWIDLIESQVYVNAEARVHRDFSSQSGVQGFAGVCNPPKTPEPRDERERQAIANSSPALRAEFANGTLDEAEFVAHAIGEWETASECAGCEDSENAPHASDCQHDSIYTIMSEWYMLDGIKKRHVMCGRCGDNLPDEYYV